MLAARAASLIAIVIASYSSARLAASGDPPHLTNTVVWSAFVLVAPMVAALGWARPVPVNTSVYDRSPPAVPAGRIFVGIVVAVATSFLALCAGIAGIFS